MRIPFVTNDSTEFALTSQQFKVLGIVFALLGLLEFGGSYFIASSITTHQAEAADQVVAQGAECKTRLEGMGFKATLKDKTIAAESSGLNDAAFKLGQASIASLSCPGWNLSKFCMGEGCGPKGGIQLELQTGRSPT